MGVDIGVTEESYLGNEDRRWLAQRKGYDSNLSGTLDASALHDEHWDEKGWVPSGLALRKTGGLWLPYNPDQGVQEVHTITVDATAGTWTITREGEITAAIAFNATAAAVQTAINGLPAVNPGDVVVTGGPGGGGGGTPYVLTYSSTEDVPNVTVQDVNLTGGGDTVGVVITTAGVDETVYDDYGLLFSSTKVGKTNDGSDKATAADPGIAVTWEGVVNMDYLPTFPVTNLGLIDDHFRSKTPHIKYVGTVI
jgi:hypothetical protein